MTTRREGADGAQAELLVGSTDLAHLIDAVVSVGGDGRDEPVGVLTHRVLADLALDADQRALDTEVVHRVDGDLDGVERLGHRSGHVALEEVFHGEHRLFAGDVFDVRAEKLVEATGVRVGEAHHRLDDAKASGANCWHGHDQAPISS